jgi:hypothetical protein
MVQRSTILLLDTGALIFAMIGVFAPLWSGCVVEIKNSATNAVDKVTVGHGLLYSSWSTLNQQAGGDVQLKDSNATNVFFNQKMPWNFGSDGVLTFCAILGGLSAALAIANLVASAANSKGQKAVNLALFLCTVGTFAIFPASKAYQDSALRACPSENLTNKTCNYNGVTVALTQVTPTSIESFSGSAFYAGFWLMFVSSLFSLLSLVLKLPQGKDTMPTAIAAY